MIHQIYRVISFKILGPYTLKVGFNDSTSQMIDFKPILKGEIYGPLQDPSIFDKVKIDSEVHTLVWPNGADFDPETLHDWPQFANDLSVRAEEWL